MSVRASVILNNYNYARYLPEAVESALAQTYPHTEVVVVDDGSTDNSRALLAGYGDRIRLVLQENGGQASAFNAGFAASRGEVVLFLDADDRLLPTAVETAVRHLEDPGVVKVHWPLRTIDAEGHSLGGLYPGGALPDGNWREVVLQNGPSSCTSPPTSGNAWSRRFLEQVLPMPEEEFRLNADAYLFGIAPAFGPLRRVREPLGCYRIHGRNHYLSASFSERIRAGMASHDAQCRALESFCQATGIRVEAPAWRAHSWFHQLQGAVELIEAQVGTDEGFILVDEDQWGTEPIVAGRRRFPFVEREGHYWGAPADDSTAVAEVERLRNAGAAWMVFAEHTFWWLEHFAGLRRHLHSRYRCALASDHLLLFDLRAGSEASV